MCVNKEFLKNADMHLSGFDRRQMMMELFRAAIRYLDRTSNIDTLVTCIPYRHERLFKALLFEPLAGLRYHAGLDWHLAAGYFLDQAYLRRNLKGVIREFFIPRRMKKSIVFRIKPEKVVNGYFAHVPISPKPAA